MSETNLLRKLNNAPQVILESLYVNAQCVPLSPVLGGGGRGL